MLRDETIGEVRETSGMIRFSDAGRWQGLHRHLRENVGPFPDDGVRPLGKKL